MLNIENMTREEFKLLFDLKDTDAAMENFDDWHEETGWSWFKIARMQIDQMDLMINEM